MHAAIVSAREDWREGHRRFVEAAAAPLRAEQLHAQLDVVSAELRQRIGGRYTLRELVGWYASSDRWARQAVAERAASAGWQRTLADVTDAAFHLASRSASDFAP
jgi:hypothetical protein